jgi:hypothetical protein
LTSLGSLTYRQSTFIVSVISTAFALSIGCHEVIVEGGFDVRNYVAIAFCVVWVIVNFLLFIGAYVRAPFMMLPWMALMVALTPIFIVAIIVGARMIYVCVRSTNDNASACSHERHVFGTTDHVLAGFKLVLLAIMLTANSLAGLFVYQFYRMLSASVTSSVSPSGQSVSSDGEPATTAATTYMYHHHQYFSRLGDDDRQRACLLPLCDDADNIEITASNVSL